MNRIYPGVLFALSLASAAVADNTIASPGAAPAADHSEQLTFDSYRAMADAAVAIDERNAPSADRINLYVAQMWPTNQLVRRASFSIDGGAQITVDLPSAVVDGIINNGDARRIARVPLAAGSHIVRVEFVVADSRKPDQAGIAVVAEQSIEKTPGPLDLQAKLFPRLFGSPKIEIASLERDDGPGRSVLGLDLDRLTPAVLAGDHYRSGGDADPALRHNRNLVRTGDERTALVELLGMGSTSRPNVVLAGPYWLDLARLMRRHGMLGHAVAICDQLDQRHEQGPEVATERLHIAGDLRSAGDNDAAEQQLHLADAALPELLRPDWRYIYGRILIDRQRPAEAVAMIGKADQTIEAFRYMNTLSESVRSAAYNRYNLAVAMVRSGDEKQGLSWLDLIGRSVTIDPEMLDLKDKANVALGWQFLREKQGRTALGVLGRVRSEGLASSSALLGMGWAELAPNGKRLPRVSLESDLRAAPDEPVVPATVKNSLIRLRVLQPELNGTMGPGSFERDEPPTEPKQALRRAIQVWSSLLTHDERDPAVQEAMLAIAYAYDQLGQPGESREAYEQAVAALSRVNAEVDAGKMFVTGGELASAIANVTEDHQLDLLMDRLHLPPEDTASDLYAAIDQYREQGRLHEALAAADAGIVGVESNQQADTAPDEIGRSLHDRLDRLMNDVLEQRKKTVQDIESLAMNRLDAHSTGLHDYLRTALLLKARIEDQPALARREPIGCGAQCDSRKD